MRKISLLLAVLLALFALPAHGQVQFTQGNSPVSRPGGTFYATAYGTWSGRVLSGNTTTGSGTSIIVTIPNALQDNTVWGPNVIFNTTMLNPILVNDNNSETVTPTAISIANCPAGNVGVGGVNQCATITGTFNNTHGQSAIVASGSFGLGEAFAAAQSVGGGMVVVDQAWASAGGTSAMIVALTPYPTIFIQDLRAQAAAQFWTLVGTNTSIAAPATLTSTTVGDALAGTAALATGGHYTNAAAYYVCIAYVDLMGQEGACSATYSFTPATGSTNQIGFLTPAKSTGAVGYTIYISLTSGTYQLAYKVPLVTQPTVVGAYPVANGVCTLTTVETITPACAVVNSTYGQTGSQAVVSAITLSTSPIDPQVTTVSTTSVYTPNAGGQTAYVYTPSNHLGIPGTLSEAQTPFTISAADATTVPSVLGTVNIAPGFMNYVGRTIEVCGKATTTASTATIAQIQFQWDAVGQNTAGKGVQIGNLVLAPPVAFATTAVYTFCEDFITTATGASATGGTILTGAGWFNGTGTAAAGTAGAGTAAAGADPTIAATASLNLAEDARLNVIYVHTTGTDGAALTLRSLTVKVVN